MSVDEIYEELRDGVPSRDAVVEHIIETLSADPALPFTPNKMRELLQYGPKLSAASVYWLQKHARDVVEAHGR